MPEDIEFPPTAIDTKNSRELLGNSLDPRRPLLAWARSVERDVCIGPHSLARAQLVLSFEGMMRVEIGRDRWFIPDRHGLWIPPEERYLITTASQIELQSFCIHPNYTDRAGMPAEPTVIRATPLLRGIARRLAPGAGDALSRPERRRLAWVALDEMARLDRSDLRLPGGHDPRVRAAVAHLLRQPRDAQNLARLAEMVGTSERTLSRLFPVETGLSWREWRDRMRFVLALEGLQQGRGSTELADWLGYSSPSAFVAAFRRRAGMSPSEWRRKI